MRTQTSTNLKEALKANNTNCHLNLIKVKDNLPKCHRTQRIRRCTRNSKPKYNLFFKYILYMLKPQWRIFLIQRKTHDCPSKFNSWVSDLSSKWKTLGLDKKCSIVSKYFIMSSSCAQSVRQIDLLVENSRISSISSSSCDLCKRGKRHSVKLPLARELERPRQVKVRQEIIVVAAEQS